MNNIDTHSYLDGLREILLKWGFSEQISKYIVDFSGLFIVLLVSIIVYHILRYIIKRILKRLVVRSTSKWDDHLYEQKVFSRLALIVPALILKVSLGPIISDYPGAISFITMSLGLYSAAVIILVAVSFLNAVYHIYGDLEVSDSKPIKGYVQIGKIIVYLIGFIVIVSILIGQSPMNLLAGLGAMSAILLLIFKDSILGFVAGVQISSNKMLQIGDWITMPKFNVDGVVIDISLVIVKVRNFDNSVSTIPTYTMVTDSYQNWRGMMESGGRRLRRSIIIDLTSIRETDDDLKEKLARYNLPGYLHEQENPRETNLGLFRRYLYELLKNHEDVNQQMLIMVRSLPPLENGIPVEFTVFSMIEDLKDYEVFQSGIMEHAIATLPNFDLKVYQRPGAAASESAKNL